MLPFPNENGTLGGSIGCPPKPEFDRSPLDVRELLLTELPDCEVVLGGLKENGSLVGAVDATEGRALEVSAAVDLSISRVSWFAPLLASSGGFKSKENELGATGVAGVAVDEAPPSFACSLANDIAGVAPSGLTSKVFARTGLALLASVIVEKRGNGRDGVGPSKDFVGGPTSILLVKSEG